MGNRFTSGKHAIAQCDRCDFRFKLKELKELVIKHKKTGILVCPTCWEKDHPQLMLGERPVHDPQAVRNPRADRSYNASGVTATGEIGEGSRVYEWGWAPVGGGSSDTLTQNSLVGTTVLSSVTVTT